MKKICVLVPCHNEESGIAAVLENIPTVKLKKLGYEMVVVVIDNNSTDKTRDIVQKTTATLIQETQQGKGYAIRHGLSQIPKDCEYVVMLDGDNTYKPQEIYRLIEPLESDFADVILGSRLSGNIHDGSFTASKRLANWFYTFLVRTFYIANVTDVLSGYFAWKREVIEALLPYLESKGFAIEMEMITKMVKMGYRIYSVPITYDKRKGDSKLVAFVDGVKIFNEFFKNLFWSPQHSSLKSQKRIKYYKALG